MLATENDDDDEETKEEEENNEMIFKINMIKKSFISFGEPQ